MRNLLFCILTILPLTASAQLTIDEAQEMARQNYPAIRQYGLVEQSRDFTLSNAVKGWLPQVSANARATYQNKVTELPIDVRQFGADFDGLSKDQYDVNVTVNQTIYDGGQIAAGKKVTQAQADVQTQQMNVTLYAIRDRVNQLFFGVLLTDEQLEQNRLLQDDLAIGLKSVEALIRGGLANETDADAVRVEQIKARQQEGTLKTMRQTYLTMLSTFIGKPLDGSTKLQKPTDELSSTEINRPELSFYDAQDRWLDTRLKALDARLMPNVGAFVQGGYGKPGLNMLGTKWDTYFKVGATLSWNIGALYTRKNDQQLIANEREQVETQRQTFLFNTRLQSQQSNGMIENLRQQISDDDAIIRLRENIRSKSERRVSNGTETVNEMLRDINAVGEARQQRAIHEVQLLQEIHHLKYIINKGKVNSEK